MMKAENHSLKLENTALTKRATEINSELFYMKVNYCFIHNLTIYCMSIILHVRSVYMK